MSSTLATAVLASWLAGAGTILLGERRNLADAFAVVLLPLATVGWLFFWEILSISAASRIASWQPVTGTFITVPALNLALLSVAWLAPAVVLFAVGRALRCRMRVSLAVAGAFAAGTVLTVPYADLVLAGDRLFVFIVSAQIGLGALLGLIVTARCGGASGPHAG